MQRGDQIVPYFFSVWIVLGALGFYFFYRNKEQMRSWGKWRWILFCGVLWVVIASPISLGLEYFVLSEEFMLEKLWFKIPRYFIWGIIWALW